MTRKQIEQKAKEMANKYPEVGYNSKYHREIYAAAMEMAEWLLSNQWVSVEDELPGEGEIAIVTFIDYKGKRRYAAGKRTGAGMQVYGVISPSPFPTVTHWMPIPTLAEEGGEK